MSFSPPNTEIVFNTTPIYSPTSPLSEGEAVINEINKVILFNKDKNDNNNDNNDNN
jgi:hypothetical protein